MLVPVLAVCTVIATLACCCYLAVKVRGVERRLSELVARRLLDSARTDEVNNLREENVVMRNLLLDIVENEASLVGLGHDASHQERTRRSRSRTARRRELFGEAVVVLDKSAAPRVELPHLTG